MESFGVIRLVCKLQPRNFLHEKISTDLNWLPPFLLLTKSCYFIIGILNQSKVVRWKKASSYSQINYFISVKIESITVFVNINIFDCIITNSNFFSKCQKMLREITVIALTLAIILYLLQYWNLFHKYFDLQIQT